MKLASTSLFASLTLVAILSCKSTVDKKASLPTIALQDIYEPANGRCLVFIGQELDAIRGLDTWNNGYLDHFARPFGFTMYTDLMPGSESFGFNHQGLNGLRTTDDWGDGSSNMSLQLADSDFSGMALAIGLDMKYDHEDDVANGDRDSLIYSLADFMHYVAWTGFSFFAADNEHHPMIAYSRKLGRPCFIAEATPVLAAPDSGEGDALDFNNPAEASKAWNDWFVPFFRTIENNPDVFKAISYINCNWKSHRMWDNVGFFNGLDVRIQLDKELSKKWNEKMTEDRYVLELLVV